MALKKIKLFSVSPQNYQSSQKQFQKLNRSIFVSQLAVVVVRVATEPFLNGLVLSVYDS